MIEILVVIAIIGILSAAIFTYLGGGRTKATDTKTREEVSQAMSFIEQYYEDHQNYGPTLAEASCPTSGTTVFAINDDIKNIIATMKASNGGIDPKCAAGGTDSLSATTWAISTPLKGDAPGDSPWCMDSSGYRGVIASGGVDDLRMFGFAPLFVNIAHAAGIPTPLPAASIGGGVAPAHCALAG